MAVATQEVLAVQTAQQASVLANKALISENLWKRLVNRIHAEHPDIDLALAERIMDQALGFLVLCAKGTDFPCSPSEMVDIGWHTFILYTREYAQFCQSIAGRFIHHSPTDEEGVDYGKGNIARTVLAMQSLGISVDSELWPNAANCNNYCRDSCSGTKCEDTGYRP